MIQNRTSVLVKDNSGLLKARCINTGKRHPGVGAHIRASVSKAKGLSRQKLLKGNGLQSILLIQTKKVISRYDGSSVKFNANTGVCVALSGAKLQLGFKRINTTVPFELKNSSNSLKAASGKASHNLMKLAKNLI